MEDKTNGTARGSPGDCFISDCKVAKNLPFASPQKTEVFNIVSNKAPADGPATRFAKKILTLQDVFLRFLHLYNRSTP